MKHFCVMTKDDRRAERPVELKVCEACGNLWVRARGAGAYCRGCAAWLAEFPVITERRGAQCPGSRVQGPGARVRGSGRGASPVVRAEVKVVVTGGVR
jgi:hypothetical protein